MKKVTSLAIITMLFFLLFGVVSAQNTFIDQFDMVMNSSPPAGASDLLDIMRSIAGFLIIAGGILAGITIIVAGIMYMAAGSNTTRAASARTIFKNGVIGALILFAAGIIVNTIILLAVNWMSFFG